MSRTYGAGEGAVEALREVDFEATRGSFTAIMGPSGSGKSTLLHLLAALDSPQTGEVWIDGVPTAHLNEDARTLLRRRMIGFVFQSFNLLPELTARENIELRQRLTGIGHPRDVDDIAQELGISDRLDRFPSEMSGGQVQRVAIARALVGDPAIVVADEPTGALDVATSRALLESLRAAVRQHEQTLVMVTHDPTVASFADRVVVLVDGKITADLQAPSAADLASVVGGLGQRP